MNAAAPLSPDLPAGWPDNAGAWRLKRIPDPDGQGTTFCPAAKRGFEDVYNRQREAKLPNNYASYIRKYSIWVVQTGAHDGVTYDDETPRTSLFLAVETATFCVAIRPSPLRAAQEIHRDK